MFPRPTAEHPDVKHVSHRDHTEYPGSKLTDMFVHRRWQFQNNTMPLPESPRFQHRLQPHNGLIENPVLDSIFFPTTYSEIDSNYREIQHSNEQLTQPDCRENDETMYEFIKRIEDEVGSKWNGSQQLAEDSCIDNIERCNENELLEMQNDVDLSQFSDWDHNAAVESSLHDLYSGSDQELTTGNQAMPEDCGDLGHEQAQGWTGKYNDEPGVSDAEMAAFWRPNYF
ncbi:hypothetical protein IL306_007457 [Fusarium sp. DS 682]|nr:hypothetical protein IL306_007457 [Fusarium sp. DS 682]